MGIQTGTVATRAALLADEIGKTVQELGRLQDELAEVQKLCPHRDVAVNSGEVNGRKLVERKCRECHRYLGATIR